MTELQMAFLEWASAKPNHRWPQWYRYCDLRDGLGHGASRTKQESYLANPNAYRAKVDYEQPRLMQ